MRAPHCAVLSDLILNAASKRLEIMRHVATGAVSHVVDRNTDAVATKRRA